MERSEGVRDLGVLLAVRGRHMGCPSWFLGLPTVMGDKGRVRGFSKTISTLFIVITKTNLHC